MKLTYDSKHNIAYLRFHKKKEKVKTVKLSDEITVDIAPDGTVYGIEFLNANEQLHAEDAGHFIFENEVLGHRKEISLS